MGVEVSKVTGLGYVGFVGFCREGFLGKGMV